MRSSEHWTPKAILSAVVFCAFLVLQIGVPTLQLWSPRPARFGWQMFGGVRQPLRYFLVYRDGTEVAIKFSDHIGNFRSDLDTAEVLPPYLCRKYPEVVEIRYRFPTETQSRSFTCD